MSEVDRAQEHPNAFDLTRDDSISAVTMA